MAAPIDVVRLGASEELDRGAFGTVYRLTSYSLPGFPELAYKEYTSPPTANEAANLRALIDFRTCLDPAARKILDEAAAWPLRLVTRGGAVCGFLMQLIPTELFGTQTLPSGAAVRLPVKAQWLVVDEAKADAAGIVVPRSDDLPGRIMLCAKLAHVLGMLHRGALIYGDLSLNNVMFTASAPSRVMLVDCDAVQSPRAPSIGQAHTDDWLPPESVAGSRAQDIASDRYKLALFILRVLTPGPHASQAVDPDRIDGMLDPQGINMMRGGLSADRHRRPTAKDWYTYLTGRLQQITSPPRLTDVLVDTQVASPGSPVTVSWRVTDATHVTVTAADGHCRPVDPSARRCRMSVTRSGPFTLRAENRYGKTTLETEPVIVLSPPTITRVDVPRIVIDTGEQRLGAALAAVRDHPVVSAGSVSLPDLAPLQTMKTVALPQVLARPGLQSAAPCPGSALTAVGDLLAALRADAEAVVGRARVASASASASAVRGSGVGAPVWGIGLHSVAGGGAAPDCGRGSR